MLKLVDILHSVINSKPAVTSPPEYINLFLYLDFQILKRSWAVTKDATASFTGPTKKTILSFRSLE